jgi:hypothetical protein
MKTFDGGLFIRLFFAFIIVTIIGTLTHELGHYLVANYFGYNAKINYDSVRINWTNKIPAENNFYINIAGPLQTILTGTVGLLLLFIYQKSFKATEKLRFGQWVIIFLSLFWLRQLANLVMWVALYFITGKIHLRADEFRIARYLKLPALSIITITGILALIVLVIVVFKFIPSKQRLTFVISGLAGGIAGYIFWIELFGKYIMP